jgi:hypothetical protein
VIIDLEVLVDIRMTFVIHTVKNHVLHAYTCLHMRVDSTRLRVDRIDTHLRHTNPTALRVESTRDFLLCNDPYTYKTLEDTSYVW